MRHIRILALATLAAILSACAGPRHLPAPTLPTDDHYAVAAVSPEPGANFRHGDPIKFEWITGPGQTRFFTIQIYPGPTFHDDQPIRVYDHIAARSFTLTSAEALPPGHYLWSAISNLYGGYRWNEPQLFTIKACERLADAEKAGALHTRIRSGDKVTRAEIEAQLGPGFQYRGHAVWWSFKSGMKWCVGFAPDTKAATGSSWVSAYAPGDLE